MLLIVKTQLQRSYYDYLCMSDNVWLQPQNMHRLCKLCEYKHFIHFIKKKCYLSWIIWALVFVVIWSRVIEQKNLMHVVCYAYNEKYETNMKCIYLMIVLSKFFWCFCRRVTSSSEIFKDFNNGFEGKCRYFENKNTRKKPQLIIILRPVIFLKI